LDEVAVRSGDKVLMEVGYKVLLIVGDPQGILDEQLSTAQFKYLLLLLLLSLLLFINLIKLYIIQSFKYLKTEYHSVMEMDSL
jgi:hypothetical protein